MKYMRILGVPPAVLMLAVLNTGMQVAQGDDDHSLARWEQEQLAAIQQHEPSLFENLLTDDFICTCVGATLGKRDFIALAEGLDIVESKIELTDRRMRIHGKSAVSTGGAALRPAPSGRITGESKVASGSAAVSLGELSGQRQPPPASAGARIVPAPVHVPQDRAVPDAPTQYRYTAVYVRLRGRWRMVALHLSPSPRK